MLPEAGSISWLLDMFIMDMFGAGMSEVADENWDCIICKFTNGAVGGAAMHIDAECAC